MMNSRCLRFIAVAILINCAYTGRLSIEENEERLANCGKSELPTPEEGEGKGGYHFELSNGSYLLRIFTLDNKNSSATCFFISPRHILTSSQSVFTENRQWLSNPTDEITDGECVSPMNVDPVHIQAIRVEWNHGETYELYKIRNATLLDLCPEIFKDFQIFFSPMLIELEEDQKDVKFPCLADSSTEIKTGDVVHAHRWQWHEENGKVSRTQYMRRNISEIAHEFITTPKKQYKEKVRGGPLVKHGTPQGTLAIGIDASTGYNDAGDTRYHDIRVFENAFCDYAGVCAPPHPSTITEGPTTPEEESTTSIPDAQTSSDPSPFASSEPSTPKPAESTSVTSKKSTTQRTIDEYEENPEDVYYDEEKRREEEEDVDNDFFVSADFITNSNEKPGFSWFMGTLVMVCLV